MKCSQHIDYVRASVSYVYVKNFKLNGLFVNVVLTRMMMSKSTPFYISGSYVPSHDMMLKFYSLFKQSTEGPCKEKRPAFWDVVGKIKYDSWKRLGNMPKEKAMQEYVDELKKIVETMSYTDNVANFMGSIDELDNISVEDLQLVAPEAIKKVRSRPNSPFHSRETSPIRSEIEYTNGNAYKNGLKNGYTNGHHQSTDTSDEEYIDTVEVRFEVVGGLSFKIVKEL